MAIKETVNLYKRSKDFKVMVKWPNDIIINDRKCAGILIENLKGKGKDFEFLAIGIGVNLILYPKNTSFKSTSLINTPNSLLRQFTYRADRGGKRTVSLTSTIVTNCLSNVESCSNRGVNDEKVKQDIKKWATLYTARCSVVILL